MAEKQEKFDAKHGIIVAGFIVLGMLLSFYPALRFDRPVIQTDGASQYVYSKVFSETWSFNAPNPEYNKYSSAETKIGDYPPLLLILLGSTIWLLRPLNADIALINGVFLGVFFAISLWFFYLIAYELTKKRTAALIALAFAVLGVRAYYTMFAGHLAPMLGFCFSIPALYFCIKHSQSRKPKHAVLCILFNILVVLAYPIQALFVLVLEVAVWLGISMQQHAIKLRCFSTSSTIISTRIDLLIDSKENKLKEHEHKDFLDFLILFISILIAIIGIVVWSTLSSAARTSWVKDWISGLLSSGYGYPHIWNYFVLIEGPIFMLLVIAGIMYLLYKQEWPVLLLSIAGFLIVMSKYFLIKEPAIVLIYVNRFLLTYYFILALIVAIVISDMLANKQREIIQKTSRWSLLVIVIMQVITLFIFFSMIAPAISEHEVQAANFLEKYSDKKILYVDNVPESISFRAFKWVLVYAKTQDYEVVHSLNSVISAEIAETNEGIAAPATAKSAIAAMHTTRAENFDLIYVSDYSGLSPEEKSFLGPISKEAYAAGNIRIYRT